MSAHPATTPPMPGGAPAIHPGMRIRITQQIPFAKGPIATSVEGEVLRVGQQKTGSWFAHSRDDKLWLDRVELRKRDGEVVVCNLDQYSLVEAI